MTLPVRYLDEYVWRLAFDPEHQRQVREAEAALARIESGESTIEEEFGPPVLGEELRQMIERLGPESPASTKGAK